MDELTDGRKENLTIFAYIVNDIDDKIFLNSLKIHMQMSKIHQ